MPGVLPFAAVYAALICAGVSERHLRLGSEAVGHANPDGLVVTYQITPCPRDAGLGTSLVTGVEVASLKPSYVTKKYALFFLIGPLRAPPKIFRSSGGRGDLGSPAFAVPATTWGSMGP